MPPPVPLRALVLAGWAAILAGPELAALARLSPPLGWSGLWLALVSVGGGVSTGLVLIGFAANLRLISAPLNGAEAPDLPARPSRTPGRRR